MPTNDQFRQRLGRLVSPDARDAAHPMRALLGAAAPLPPYHAWLAGPVLDQGQSPECVAYAWEGWLNASPTRTISGDPPETIYARAQAVDEWAGTPHDGTSVRAGAKVMLAEGRVGRYVWADGIATAREWLARMGSVVFGTNWYDAMFTPDSTGLVRVEGALAGGHAFICLGYDDRRSAFLFQNSWGRSWGHHGRFWIADADVARLLSEQGEACAAVEVVPGG